MIRNVVLGIFIWAAVAASSLAATAVGNLSDVSYWVGSGQNQAVLIIDWQDGKNAPGESVGQAIAWGYRWPAGETRTGEQMLMDIVAADPRLVMARKSFGFGELVFGFGYDLDGDGGSFTFDPQNEMGFPSDSHDHFAEGFEFNGFWAYTVGQSTGARPSFSESMEGAFSRELINGSWDAWVFTTDLSYPYTIPTPPALMAAVPEPSGAMLLGVGSIGFLHRRRRSG